MVHKRSDDVCQRKSLYNMKSRCDPGEKDEKEFIEYTHVDRCLAPNWILLAEREGVTPGISIQNSKRLHVC